VPLPETARLTLPAALLRAVLPLRESLALPLLMFIVDTAYLSAFLSLPRLPVSAADLHQQLPFMYADFHNHREVTKVLKDAELAKLAAEGGAVPAPAEPVDAAKPADGAKPSEHRACADCVIM
jgi:hypothetical protein